MFTADIIQPLFDLANSGSDLHRQVEEQVKRGENQNAAGGKAAPKAGSIQVVNQNNSSGGNQNSGDYRIWDVSRSAHRHFQNSGILKMLVWLIKTIINSGKMDT